MKGLIVVSALVFSLFTSGVALAGDRVRISEVCGNCTRSELMKVGKKAEVLYRAAYGKAPAKDKSGTNIYSSEDIALIKRAIAQVK